MHIERDYLLGDKMKKTIKNIDCYGSVKNADYFLVADEMDGYIFDNWKLTDDRKFKNWSEVIKYLLWHHSFNGEIQEIIAE
tara:strand:- start:176 stop:418 length:243 start_codon:yes stop_codon:yes gene_type:complete